METWTWYAWAFAVCADGPRLPCSRFNIPYSKVGISPIPRYLRNKRHCDATQSALSDSKQSNLPLIMQSPAKWKLI